MKRTLIGTIIVTLMAGSCQLTPVPRATLDLSEGLGRSLEEAHASHRQVVVQYFERIKASVDLFRDEVYLPALIESVVDDEGIYEMLEGLGRADRREAAVELQLTIKMLMRRASEFHWELLSKIERQEATVLMELDNFYNRLKSNNALLTGYLMSARGHDYKLETVDTVLREEFLNQGIDLSYGIHDAFDTARASGDYEGILQAIKILR